MRCGRRSVLTVIDAGHLYPKAMFPAVRWDEWNVFGQCRAHNKLHIRQPFYYMDWFLMVHGKAVKDALLRRATGKPLTLEQMETRAAELRAKVEGLELLAAAAV